MKKGVQLLQPSIQLCINADTCIYRSRKQNRCSIAKRQVRRVKNWPKSKKDCCCLESNPSLHHLQLRSIYSVYMVLIISRPYIKRIHKVGPNPWTVIRIRCRWGISYTVPYIRRIEIRHICVCTVWANPICTQTHRLSPQLTSTFTTPLKHTHTHAYTHTHTKHTHAHTHAHTHTHTHTHTQHTHTQVPPTDARHEVSKSSDRWLAGGIASKLLKSQGFC